MASSLYAPAMVDVLDATQLGLDLTAAGNKAALFTNLLTPNYLADSSFGSAPYTANQVSSAGYTAGGLTITTPTLTAAGSAPVITYDADNLSWTGVSLTARYAIFYAAGLGGTPVFYGLDFGADFTASSGPFTVIFDTLGIWTWTL